MNSYATLETSLNILTQIQGKSLDPLKIKAACSTLILKENSLNNLSNICFELGIDPPQFLSTPDRARLPFITLNAVYGWGVVYDRDPNDFWMVNFNGVYQTLLTIDLNNCIAEIKIEHIEKIDSFKEILKSSLFRHKGILIEASIATIFMGILTLSISLFSMQVYDRVIPTKGEDTLITLTVGVILAISIELLMKFARSKILDDAVIGIDSQLSRNIFERLLSVRLDQLPGSVGSLAGQIRSYEQIRSFYTAATLFSLVDLPISLFFIVIIAFIASPYAALAPFIFALIGIFIGIVARKKLDFYAREGSSTNNLKTGLLVEVVEGAETIKAGAGSWKMLARWMEVSSASIKNDARLRRITESLAYAAALLQQLCYASLVVIGAILVMKGDMTMGAVIATSILGGRIMAPILAIPSLMVQHAYAKAATESLEQLYALKIDSDGISRPLIPSSLYGNYRLTEVKFCYSGSPLGINISDLSINSGERIGIIGPIGAGKTTLLRLLAGLYWPQSGKVLLDNLDLGQICRQVICSKIGYLQQDHRLFFGTLRENLLIGLPELGDDELQSALYKTGLDKLVASHPRGLDLPIMEGGRGLSGGQRQLLAFTRLILSNPSILLLDEPTASMDEAQERRCLKIISECLITKKTLIVASHKASLLSLVDRLIVISDNKIILDGKKEIIIQELKNRFSNAG